MYVLEYLLYHLRPFGIQNTLSGTAPPPPDHDLKATPWAGPTGKDEEESTDPEEDEPDFKKESGEDQVNQLSEV